MSYAARVCLQRNADTYVDSAKTTSFFKSSHKHTSNADNHQSFIQARLNIGKPDDKFEKEADAVAEAVATSQNSSSSQAQSKKLNSIQRLASSAGVVQQKSDGIQSASSHLSTRIESTCGKGNAMPQETLADMGTSFAHDFSDVNIHTGRDAIEMNRELGAQAFTYGRDIYFNSGKYNPESTTGKELLAHELTHVVQQRGTTERQLRRKISVQDPDKNIPNPDGKGLTQTNELTVLEYMAQLCPDTDFMVGGGKVEFLDTGFCFPSEEQDDGTFKSPSELSVHSVSCECLCEMIMDPLDVIIIKIDDNVEGTGSTNTAGGATEISVPSPNAKKQTIRGASGASIDSPPHIILAHELCGHHWLERRGVDEGENMGNERRGGHDPTIKRENEIRAEHGLGQRGTFRDPCCGLGESTAEDLAKPKEKCGKEFEEAKKKHRGLAYECQHWRDEYNKLNDTSFTTDDAIPEKEDETLPAKWRIEVFFKKDAPQDWLTLEQSLTEVGKHNLETVLTLMTKHSTMKAQLAGNASSDKAAGDPDFNTKLAKRRAEYVLNHLMEKGITEDRFTTFDSDCDELKDGVHNCGDTESEKKTNELDRNVEVKLF